jgi:O-antigen ligase
MKSRTAGASISRERRPEIVSRPSGPFVQGRQISEQSSPQAAGPSRFRALLGYGLASLPCIGAVVPFAIGTGTGSNIVAVLIVSMGLIGLWCVGPLVTREFVLMRSPLNLPVGLFGLAWVLAFLWSNASLDPRIAVRLGMPFTIVQAAATSVTLVSLALLLLGANVGYDRRYVRAATWGFLAVGVVAVLVYFTHTDAWFPFLSTLGLFTNWVVALAYGQALFNHRLSTAARLGLLALTAACLVQTAVFETAWLSGWVPPLVAVALITLLRSRVLFTACFMAGSTVCIAFAGRIYEAVFQSQLDEGSDSRLDIWAQAWDLLGKHPVLGTGPAGYAAYYMTLYQGSGSSMSTHSNYMDVAAETGIVGSLGFIWLLVAFAVVAWQACRRWRNGFEGGFAHGAAGGLAGIVIGMALGDWVIPFVYNQGIGGFRYTVHTWVFLGFLAGLAAVPVASSDR